MVSAPFLVKEDEVLGILHLPSPFPGSCPSLDPRWLTPSLAHEPPIGCGKWEALQDIKGGTVSS